MSGYQEAAAGMFTNLGYEDKQAFFSLLDEYFASRPHLVGGGDDGGSTGARSVASPPPARSAGPPPTNALSRPAERAAAPARPTTSYTPSSTASTTNQRNGGGPTAFVNSGIGKVAGNQHVSGALGKLGAGGFASKMDKKYNTPAPRHGTGVSSSSSRPPPTGLQSNKAFGHIDTSSGVAAVKSMWSNDPNYKQQTANPTQHALPPPVRTGAVLPPPSRNVGVDAQVQDPVPPYSGAGRVKALYDYDGNDEGDLPLQAGQIVTLVNKKTEDWWICKDDNGREGLVPANYVEEQ